ncbi:MAG: BatA and WFA domain-containing protein, partial [Bacteroidia bacterium]|nr:BatA and WFA domain-containing protein [Bacteroidia bacterium]
MTFLNPAFLWLATAIAVPVIVHLFNFRRPRKVLFSHLAFVREVNKAVLRRLKLRRLLLLAVRITAIAALALAFADPVILRKNAEVAAADRSVVILLDNSYSMSAADERGIYLEQAKSLAKEIVKAYASTDEFQILTTGGGKFIGTFYPQKQALETVDGVTFHNRLFSIGQALQNLPQYFANARKPGRIFYFISDFQQSTVLQDTLREWRIPSEISVKFLCVGRRKQSNLYIADLAFETPTVEKGRPAIVSLKIENESESEVEKLGVKMELEGRPAATASIDVKPGQSQSAQMTLTPERGGWLSGSVSIEDSPIEFDNTRYFSFYIPENAKLLLVTSDEDPSYLKLFYQNLMGQYRTQVVDRRALGNVEWEEYEGAIFAGDPQIGSGTGQKIKSWLENGGGIMVFPSWRSDMTALNDFLTQIGAGKYGAASEAPTRFARPDLEHPLFQGVFSNARADGEFDGPNLVRSVDFYPAGSGVQNTVIRDEKGRPMLHETRVGAGGAYIFAFYPSLAWGDFPLKTSFAPILYRTTLAFSPHTRHRTAYGVGEPVVKQVRPLSRKPIKLRASDGAEYVPEQYPQAGRVALRFDRLEIPAGNYALMQGDTLLEKISFNYPDAESRTAKADESRLRKFLDERGLSEIEVVRGAPEWVRQNVGEQSVGVSLWKYFLALTL